MSNFFSMFNLEPRFEIDQSLLDNTYRSLLAQTHPDRHSQSTPSEKRSAEMKASALNQAYQLIKKPVSRAQHILQIAGYTQKPDVGFNFLEQQVEWRESIEVARSTANHRLLDALDKEIREVVNQMQDQLKKFLDQDRDFANGAKTATQLQFVEKILDEVGNAQFSLEVL